MGLEGKVRNAVSGFLVWGLATGIGMGILPNKSYAYTGDGDTAAETYQEKEKKEKEIAEKNKGKAGKAWKFLTKPFTAETTVEYKKEKKEPQQPKKEAEVKKQEARKESEPREPQKQKEDVKEGKKTTKETKNPYRLDALTLYVNGEEYSNKIKEGEIIYLPFDSYLSIKQQTAKDKAKTKSDVLLRSVDYSTIENVLKGVSEEDASNILSVLEPDAKGNYDTDKKGYVLAFDGGRIKFSKDKEPINPEDLGIADGEMIRVDVTYETQEEMFGSTYFYLIQGQGPARPWRPGEREKPVERQRGEVERPSGEAHRPAPPPTEGKAPATAKTGEEDGKRKKEKGPSRHIFDIGIGQLSSSYDANFVIDPAWKYTGAKARYAYLTDNFAAIVNGHLFVDRDWLGGNYEKVSTDKNARVTLIGKLPGLLPVGAGVEAGVHSIDNYNVHTLYSQFVDLETSTKFIYGMAGLVTPPNKNFHAYVMGEIGYIDYSEDRVFVSGSYPLGSEPVINRSHLSKGIEAYVGFNRFGKFSAEFMSNYNRNTILSETISGDHLPGWMNLPEFESSEGWNFTGKLAYSPIKPLYFWVGVSHSENKGTYKDNKKDKFTGSTFEGGISIRH